MTLARPARKVATTIAVALMLFAQFVVAAHACDAIRASAPHGAMAASQGDSPCEPAAPAQDKVCFDHCSGAQSVDNHPGSPLVPTLMPVCTVAHADASRAFLDSTQRYAHALLARVTAPPLAVRHCCFRT